MKVKIKLHLLYKWKALLLIEVSNLIKSAILFQELKFI